MYSFIFITLHCQKEFKIRFRHINTTFFLDFSFTNFTPQLIKPIGFFGIVLAIFFENEFF